MKVLILEDEEIIRTYFVMLAKTVAGVSAVEATGSGAEALKIAEDFRPDLVLLDYDLKGQDVNGLEVGAGIKKLLPDIYTILISGFPVEYFSNQPIQPHGFVVKPIVKDKFLALIKSFISQLQSNRS